MRKIIGLALILSSLVLSFSREINVTFPTEGRYTLFLQNQESDVLILEGKSSKMDVPEGNMTIFIRNPEGFVAKKTFTSKDNALSLTPKDFHYVEEIEIRLTDAKGNPLDVAVVSLTDSQGEKHTLFLTEEGQGKCVFRFVPFGKVSIEARRGNLRAMQEVEVSGKEPRPSFTIAFASLSLPQPQKVETPRRTKEGKKEAPPSFMPPLISVFISLVIVLMIIAAILGILKMKGVDVFALLRRTREAPIPPAPSSSTPIPVDSDICPYCGQRKDPVTGACACTPVAPASPSVPLEKGARLIGIEGTVVGKVFPLTGTVSLGRSPDRDIVIEDDAVSRRHCRIEEREDGYYIIDEGSTNGTFVGGVKITQERLKNGDILQIGKSKFRFEIVT